MHTVWSGGTKKKLHFYYCHKLLMPNFFVVAKCQFCKNEILRKFLSFNMFENSLFTKL